MEVLNFKQIKENMTDQDFFEMKEQIEQRKIKTSHLNEIGAAKLNHVFIVVYGSTNEIILFDGQSLDAEQRVKLIYCLIDQIQIGSNLEREIIGQSGNVYFVY